MLEGFPITVKQPNSLLWRLFVPQSAPLTLFLWHKNGGVGSPHFPTRIFTFIGCQKYFLVFFRYVNTWILQNETSAAHYSPVFWPRLASSRPEWANIPKNTQKSSFLVKMPSQLWMLQNKKSMQVYNLDNTSHNFIWLLNSFLCCCKGLKRGCFVFNSGKNDASSGN